MTRILLIGSSGQVGCELLPLLANVGDVIALQRSQLDLASSEAIRDCLVDIKPQIIVNAAAYTSVDGAESEPEVAHLVNAIAPTVMAQEAKRLGALLIHFSTDYVFDGYHHTPYIEGDTPSPANVYGCSKLAGEEGIRQICPEHLILRTAWLYGIQGHGNFVKTILNLGAENQEIRVVFDQIGTPTYAKDLAQSVIGLIEKVNSNSCFKASLLGTYHFANSGVASWYDFAVAVFEEAKTLGFPLKLKKVIPISTAEYSTLAMRPSYSVLSCQKLNSVLGKIPPHWRQSLRDMLANLYCQTYESSYSLGW